MTLAEDTAALGLSPGMFDSVAHIPAVLAIVSMAAVAALSVTGDSGYKKN
jgi:hypothetical protein